MHCHDLTYIVRRKYRGAQALLDRMADGELDPARALHAAIRLQQLAEDGTLAENLLQLREKRPQAEPAEPRGAQAAN